MILYEEPRLVNTCSAKDSARTTYIIHHSLFCYGILFDIASNHCLCFTIAVYIKYVISQLFKWSNPRQCIFTFVMKSTHSVYRFCKEKYRDCSDIPFCHEQTRFVFINSCFHEKYTNCFNIQCWHRKNIQTNK